MYNEEENNNLTFFAMMPSEFYLEGFEEVITLNTYEDLREAFDNRFTITHKGKEMTSDSEIAKILEEQYVNGDEPFLTGVNQNLPLFKKQEVNSMGDTRVEPIEEDDTTDEPEFNIISDTPCSMSLSWVDEGNLEGKLEELYPNSMVNKPRHYIGEQGLEVETVLQNFVPRYTNSYVAHRVASSLEYLLRAPLKNKREDLEKAKKNIEQALDYIDSQEEDTFS